MTRRYFTDTSFWIAIADPHDQFHTRALAYRAQHADAKLVTSEDVLAEVLTFFSSKGPHRRQQAYKFVRIALEGPYPVVWSRSESDFREAVEFFGRRQDKGYSFTDCLSMVLARRHGIESILTFDHHFSQEGFEIAG